MTNMPESLPWIGAPNSTAALAITGLDSTRARTGLLTLFHFSWCRPVTNWNPAVSPFHGLFVFESVDTLEPDRARPWCGRASSTSDGGARSALRANDRMPHSAISLSTQHDARGRETS